MTFYKFCEREFIEPVSFKQFISFRYLYTLSAVMQSDDLLEKAWKSYLAEYLVSKHKMLANEESK